MNYYETLGILQDADQSMIKRAYYAAVKKHSPDKDPDMFKGIRAAYETLSKPEKREEYDKLFRHDVTDQVRQELLASRDLLANHQYKEVANRLTDKKKPKYDNAELNLILAKAYLGMGKSGLADALAKKILESEPDNAEAVILLASACVKKGHIYKADEHYLKWLERNPVNSKVWGSYLVHVQDNFPLFLPDEIERAFDIDKSNLKDYPHLYLVGCGCAMKNDLEYRALEFLEEFTKCLKAGIDLGKEEYEVIVHIFRDLAKSRILRASISGALPTLLQSKHRHPDVEDALSVLETFAAWVALSKDARIHDIFRDYTELLIAFDGCESCKNDRGTMELYIIENLDELRSCLRIIRQEHPKLYSLDTKFFSDVLDARKADALQDRGAKTYRQLAKSGAFDDFDDFPVEMPYVRDVPKVGRNNPCPCGSGKKYKRCCG